MVTSAPTPDESEIGLDFQRSLDEELMHPALRWRPRPLAPAGASLAGSAGILGALWRWLAVTAGASVRTDARGGAREVDRR